MVWFATEAAGRMEVAEASGCPTYRTARPWCHGGFGQWREMGLGRSEGREALRLGFRGRDTIAIVPVLSKLKSVVQKAGDREGAGSWPGQGHGRAGARALSTHGA